MPLALSGSFHRCGGDTAYPALENDILNNGGRVMAAFHFQDGYVDCIQRYVKTERYLLERRNRRRLYGLYRNGYTDQAETGATAGFPNSAWRGRCPCTSSTGTGR